ncbi:hypothetical protein CAC42_2892 [Sphaceloma murrayae]|uniref:Uncharacterized protein n=1 Tax=Sphaceloma murrayae TaxID=2082308 RepID=A0A2K1R024_9PEZI|nr:hypothetical protein CAC42_2892 [Sphaceloma murrayae]
MGRPNFTRCGETFFNGITRADPAFTPFSYQGSSTKITFEGCKALCGSGSELYNAADVSDTLNTWILPLVAVVVQAPFESGKAWETMKLVTRYLGSPVVSLYYGLANIADSRRLAMMIDMSTPIQGFGKNADDYQKFLDMRDSLYILSVMNQFALTKLGTEGRRSSKAEEATRTLLRIALFSGDLPNSATCGCTQNASKPTPISAYRRRVAADLRSNRKRGVVPVFISTVFFLAAMALSIFKAVDEVGTADYIPLVDLGLLLSTLPCIVLCFVVDRNPIDPDGNRKTLNDLVRIVCAALVDDATFDGFEECLRDECGIPACSLAATRIRSHLSEVRRLCVELGTPNVPGVELLSTFAGQGRTRWHRGVARDIMSDIHMAVAEGGRGWLLTSDHVPSRLVLGNLIEDAGRPPSQGWHFASATGAFVLFLASALGAFYIAYRAPPVGVGCRSAQIVGFVATSVTLFATEAILAVLGWDEVVGLQRHAVKTCRARIDHWLGRLQATIIRIFNRSTQQLPLAQSKDEPAISLASSESRAVSSVPPADRPDSSQAQKVPSTTPTNDKCKIVPCWSARRVRFARYVLDPAECLNTVYLLSILITQALGAHRTCECISQHAIRGSAAYVDFRAYEKFLLRHWAGSLAVAMLIMLAGLLHVVSQWALQSHMNTSNAAEAMKGLKSVRRWRIRAFPARRTGMCVSEAWRRVVDRLCGRGQSQAGRSAMAFTSQWTPDKPPAGYDARDSEKMS